MAAKKTWREKINETEEKFHMITPEYEERYGKGKILISKPLDIERLINQTKNGELLTNDIIREVLTKEKKVQATDPITVGIFLRIIAEAAEEEKETEEKVTPYWRVLKPDGTINIKLPGGVKRQIEYLETEGHSIIMGKGKKPPKVDEFESKLKRY